MKWLEWFFFFLLAGGLSFLHVRFTKLHSDLMRINFSDLGQPLKTVNQDLFLLKELLHKIHHENQPQFMQTLVGHKGMIEDFGKMLNQFSHNAEQAEAMKLNVVRDFRKEMQDFPAHKLVQEIKSIHEVFKKDVIFFLSYIKSLDVVHLQQVVVGMDQKVDQLRVELSSHKIPMKFG